MRETAHSAMDGLETSFIWGIDEGPDRARTGPRTPARRRPLAQYFRLFWAAPSQPASPVGAWGLPFELPW